jgi:hypothetical protein
MDESVIRAHLNEIARIDETLSQVEDNVVDVQLEDDWAGVSLTSSLPREALRSLHAQLSAQMPGYSLEINAGDDVYRGGVGFGPGKHLIAVLGGNGGVGKTTVSVNLALTLSAMGQSVGLLDGDLTAPDVPHMFGIHRTGQEHQSTLRIWHQDVTPPSRRLDPHRRLGLERRTLPGETGEQIEREVKTLLEGCRAADPAFEASHRTLLVREPFEIGQDEELVTLVADAAAGGRPPRGRRGGAPARAAPPAPAPPRAPPPAPGPPPAPPADPTASATPRRAPGARRPSRGRR